MFSIRALGTFSSLSPVEIFNPPYWINWVHLSVGTATAVVALKGNTNTQRGFDFVPAVLASTLGIIGVTLSLYGLHGHASEPLGVSDHVTNFCVGGMASWAVWNRRPRTT